jgi:hypothetical protein
VPWPGMKQSGPLPQANEEHKAVSSFNEKTQSCFLASI